MLYTYRHEHTIAGTINNINDERKKNVSLD